MNNEPLIIGLDGGGTKTLAWLASISSGQPEILGKGQAGAGNPRAVGFSTALNHIDQAIAGAFAQAGLERTTVRSACLCLAGAGREGEQEQIRDWANMRRFSEQISIGGDAEPVLAAASPTGIGIALISGTGSLAWGRNSSGRIDRTGGWGYFMGDEGSGYAIARAGLRAAVQYADGRGAETALLNRFLQAFRISELAELIETVYAPEMNRDRLAAAAVEVFDVAETDGVAGEIVERAAVDLASMVSTLAGKLDLPEGFPLGLAGSVLLNQARLRERIVSLLRTSGAAPADPVLVPEPVWGALLLAQRAIES